MSCRSIMCALFEHTTHRTSRPANTTSYREKMVFHVRDLFYRRGDSATTLGAHFKLFCICYPYADPPTLPGGPLLPAVEFQGNNGAGRAVKSHQIHRDSLYKHTHRHSKLHTAKQKQLQSRAPIASSKATLRVGIQLFHGAATHNAYSSDSYESF